MSKITLFTLLIIIPTILASTVTVGDNQPWLQKTFVSKFELGKVYIKQTIKWNFLHKADPIEITLKLKDSTDTVIDTQTCASNPCTATFDATTILVQGNYYILAQFTTPQTVSDGTAGTYARVGQLTITGDNSARASSTIVRVTTSIGPYRYHRIYIPIATPAYKVFSYSESSTFWTWVNRQQILKIIKQNDNSTKFQLDGGDYIVPTAGEVAADPSAGMGTITVTFTPVSPAQTFLAGYYWILVDVYEGVADTADTFQNNWRYILSYGTQPYICPYDKSYPDHKNIFAGCIEKSAVTELPCVVFNQATQKCSQCYIGYHLQNGKCLVDQCPAGKYFNDGKCFDNPLGCKSFNQVTDCTECVDTYRLKVDSVTQRGVCERIPLVCTGRTYYNVAKYICDKVSDDCKQFSSVDGKCTSCDDMTKKLVDGTCITAIDNCGVRQYIQNGNCIDANPLCQTFERVGGKCLSCIFGYKFDDNKNCVMINCPTGYVPNDYGNCRKVSQLCQTYDLKGRCLICVPSHQPDANGQCLQSQSPTPCPARQYLGFDSTCHQISQFCDIYNAQQKYCVKCKGIYLLNTASNTCVPPSQCTGNFYRVNNDCKQVDVNCKTWKDDQRKCLQCKPNFEDYYGICIATYKCQARQWKDGNKQCQNVSPLCGDFDPSTGKCITCAQSTYQLKNGICCPNGQYNVNGVCTAADSAAQVNNLDGCKLVINGNGCVSCNTGFTQSEGPDGLGICTKN